MFGIDELTQEVRETNALLALIDAKLDSIIRLLTMLVETSREEAPFTWSEDDEAMSA